MFTFTKRDNSPYSFIELVALLKKGFANINNENDLLVLFTLYIKGPLAYTDLLIATLIKESTLTNTVNALYAANKITRTYNSKYAPYVITQKGMHFLPFCKILIEAGIKLSKK